MQAHRARASLKSRRFPDGTEWRRILDFFHRRECSPSSIRPWHNAVSECRPKRLLAIASRSLMDRIPPDAVPPVNWVLPLERAACWGPKGMARTTISCRKSEIRLSLPHEQSCASAWPRPQAPVPALRTPGKRAEKKYSRFKLRNPLKSLDSDERIQGNPRKSNAHERGALAAKRPRAKKIQTGSDRTHGAARSREVAKPAPYQRRSAIGSKRAGEPQRAARSLDDEIAVDQVPHWVADQR